MVTPPRSRLSSVASAAALVSVMGLFATDASALALGRLSVLSGLGEPLRAEIELPQISAAEADSLRASIASPEAYKASGLEYNTALSGLRLALQQRPDGRSVLRISGDRPVNEPFLDLVLEANWAAGKTVRDYTLLLDPPTARRAPAVVAAPLAQITPPAMAQQPAPVAPPRPSRPAVAASPATAPPPAAPRPVTPPSPSPVPRAPSASADTGHTVTVQRGDTASKIAAAVKPAHVSLDQMLVALLRANPTAFSRDNINRIRAGAVLEVPSESQAAAVPKDTAKQQVLAQSKDFNDYRSKLAGIAPGVQVATADRAASGRIESQVTDKKTAAETNDKLTLSKGSVQGASAEERIAQENRAKDASTRLAELSKNISELNRIGTASGTAAPANAGASAPAAGIPALAAPTETAAPPVVEAASAPAAAAPVAAPASAAAPSAVAAVPAPATEPSFLESLTNNKGLLALLGTLAALLAGLGIYHRSKKSKQGSALDSSFLESRGNPDSFFGASGGQRVDTNGHSSTGNASLNYSHSQLDAGGDVDPVAEADVYLAYGRDLQAEEILKEALRSNPTRPAIHAKLLDIYAKRQDAQSFQSVATELRSLTQGEGPDWEHASQLGRDIDPTNPAYQPSPRASQSAALAAVAAAGSVGAAAAVHTPAAADTMASQFAALDLDLDLGAEPSPPPAALPPVTPGAANFSSFAPEATPAAPLAVPVPEATAYLATDTMGLSALDDLEFTLENHTDLAPLAPVAAPQRTDHSKEWTATHSGMIDFDMGAISLDLDDPVDTDITPLNTEISPLGDIPNGAAENPLATKLALAQEFNTIGDTDGARTLCEEVVAEATGSLKTRAQRLLAELG